MSGCIVAIALLLASLPSRAEVLKFYAEDLPPYHYVDSEGKTTGALVEIVEALSKKAKINADIRLLPFARGYQLMLSNTNAFMFSLIRTKAREPHMQWVGKIYHSDAYLVGLKGREELQVKDLEAAKKFVVGTIRGYHSERFLKDAGFSLDHNLSLSVNYHLMWQMLFRRRIDYVLTNTVSLDTELTSLGLDTNEVDKYLAVKHFPSELFIVTHLATKKVVVDKIANALAAIKQDGEYQRIIDKWGL